MSKDDQLLLRLDNLLSNGKRDDAFRLLYNTYSGTLLKFSNSISSSFKTSNYDRETIVNDTLVNTFEKLEQGKILSNLESYMISAVRYNLKRNSNKWWQSIGRFRKDKYRFEEEETLLPLLKDLDGDENNLIFKVRKAFKSLGPECRQRIRMVKMFGYSHADVIEELPGTGSRDNSRTKLSACMRLLRKRIKD